MDITYNWCHAPNCHKRHTTNRIRGVKGNKVLRTRKIQECRQDGEYYRYWDFFCDQTCLMDYISTHIADIIRIAPRLTPLETPIDVKITKHPEQQFGEEDGYRWTRSAWTETSITEK